MGRGRTDLLTAGLLWVAVLVGPRECLPVDFLRGDFQPSGEVDIGDAIRIFAYMFDEIPPDDPCTAAADVDADHRLDVVDGVRLLEFLFLAGKPPARGPRWSSGRRAWGP